eukprot:GFKZ01003672.1.p2 GENE.GFKZ01003672.1~~GFKZ01003672.1.p2  ORF type:complete len:131 (+),score=2.57 GFKZ01003672.1:273-665(+)
MERLVIPGAPVATANFKHQAQTKNIEARKEMHSLLADILNVRLLLRFDHMTALARGRSMCACGMTDLSTRQHFVRFEREMRGGWLACKRRGGCVDGRIQAGVGGIPCRTAHGGLVFAVKSIAFKKHTRPL